MLGVLFALFAFAVGAAGFGNLDRNLTVRDACLKGECRVLKICSFRDSRLKIWWKGGDVGSKSTYVDLENRYVSIGTAEK